MTTVNVQELESKVQDMYREVAENPRGEFHFEMGRSLAERLGYGAADLDRIPAEAIESFAGVGYFFHLARLSHRSKSMIFKPFHYFDTGCAAYLFGCGTAGRCAVVDPQERDVDAYATFAKAKGMTITHVFETHVHADHRSGGRKLALQAGAKYCLHSSADVSFPFEPVKDGQRIELGNTIVDILHTPGHTPESISLVVRDLRRGPAPWFVCTGDTLFVGAVGRPDLPGQTEKNAAELHRTLHEKLLLLPDTIEIFPAHFAGSACGAGLSGKPSSTLAFEKEWNPMLSADRDTFVGKLSGQPTPQLEGMEAILRFNQGRD